MFTFFYKEFIGKDNFLCVNESKNTREKRPYPAKEELSKVVKEMSCGLSLERIHHNELLSCPQDVKRPTNPLEKC